MLLLPWSPLLEMVVVTFNNVSIFFLGVTSPAVKVFPLDDSCDAWKGKVLSGEALNFSAALILSGFPVTIFHVVHL